MYLRFFVLFLLSWSALNAHQLRENYLRVEENATTHTVTLHLEVETRLFETDVLDDNHNGLISFKELRHHKQQLLRYIFEHIHLTYHKKELSFKNASVRFHRYQVQTYMELQKSFSDVELDGLCIRYSMFFDLESNHKLIIHLQNNNDAVVDKEHPTYCFSSAFISQYQRLRLFIREGIFHILDGIDHLLFIFMLLIPSVMLYANHGGFRKSFFSLIKIITTFSFAHSLTLFIAGAGFYHPNVTFIESSIALSIFVVAVLNFFGKYQHVDYKIVFLFGLIHGFGFANVLEIAQVRDTLSFFVALFGFNFGVELGQIGVIVLVLPLLFGLMRWKYHSYILRFLTSMTIVISSYWFLQRLSEAF